MRQLRATIIPDKAGAARIVGARTWAAAQAPPAAREAPAWAAPVQPRVPAVQQVALAAQRLEAAAARAAKVGQEARRVSALRADARTPATRQMSAPIFLPPPTLRAIAGFPMAAFRQPARPSAPTTAVLSAMVAAMSSTAATTV